MTARSPAAPRVASLVMVIGLVLAALAPVPSARAQAAATASTPPAAHDVAVRVSKNGPAYVVDASFSVAVSQDIAWDVLTDFDAMAQILSSVDASRIVNRKDNGFDVEQQSHAAAGPLRITLDSVRRVELTPRREITSVLVRADSVDSSNFTTLVTPQGPLTRIDVHGTFVPGWLAAAMVDVQKVEARVRRQYAEFRAEMLRRKSGEPRPACLATKTCP